MSIEVQSTTTEAEGHGVEWWALAPDAAVAEAKTDGARGLAVAEAEKRLAQVGPNALQSAPPPSVWRIALSQVLELMTLMLIAVTIISLLIQQFTTAIIVAILVLFNVVTGTRQEVKARRSVDALAKLQTPQARVVRDGSLLQIPATGLVPGLSLIHI